MSTREQNPDPEWRATMERAHREALAEYAADPTTDALREMLAAVKACVRGRVPDCGALPCGFPCLPEAMATT